VVISGLTLEVFGRVSKCVQESALLLWDILITIIVGDSERTHNVNEWMTSSILTRTIDGNSALNVIFPTKFDLHPHTRGQSLLSENTDVAFDISLLQLIVSSFHSTATIWTTTVIIICVGWNIDMSEATTAGTRQPSKANILLPIRAFNASLLPLNVNWNTAFY
jgi:hypothetical protein